MEFGFCGDGHMDIILGFDDRDGVAARLVQERKVAVTVNGGPESVPLQFAGPAQPTCRFFWVLCCVEGTRKPFGRPRSHQSRHSQCAHSQRGRGPGHTRKENPRSDSSPDTFGRSASRRGHPDPVTSPRALCTLPSSLFSQRAQSSLPPLRDALRFRGREMPPLLTRASNTRKS